MICKKEIQVPVISKLKLTTAFMLLAVLLSPFTALAQATAGQKYEAGVHYDVLDKPVRTRDKSKIEVVEVFWYGCSHCYNFESLVTQWKSKQANDVDFWRSPAIWNSTMALHARAFYTVKALKVEEKLHIPLFTTMVVERKQLSNISQIENLFADYGVDRAKFKKTFESFGVESQTKQADARARSYKVTGTPEVVVNGKYRVGAKKAGSQTKMLDVIDYLIAKERAQLAVK